MELSLDVWSHIAKFIKNNATKCRLLMTCKGISKFEFYFYGIEDIDKIDKSGWFDHFVNIWVDTEIKRLPLSIRKLSFGNSFNKPIGMLPSTITKLTVGLIFDQQIEECIPSSVTYLKFGCKYFPHLMNNMSDMTYHYFFTMYQMTKSSRNIIPLSITKIKLEWYHYNIPWTAQKSHIIQAIIKCDWIPSPIFGCPYITHLVFDPQHKPWGDTYDRIPPAVTHLTFGKKITDKLENIGRLIHSSVTHLTFVINFESIITDLPLDEYINQKYMIYVPETAKEISFVDISDSSKILTIKN